MVWDRVKERVRKRKEGMDDGEGACEEEEGGYGRE